jgi:hypothetical protein
MLNYLDSRNFLRRCQGGLRSHLDRDSNFSPFFLPNIEIDFNQSTISASFTPDCFQEIDIANICKNYLRIFLTFD